MRQLESQGPEGRALRTRWILRSVVFRPLVVVLVSSLPVAACSRGASSGGDKPEPKEPEPPHTIVVGTAEKGPFVDGTVTVAALDGAAPVTTEIRDVLGSYTIRVPVAPAYRLEAEGRPYRETTGQAAPTLLVLRALHVPTGGLERVHVNVLTHLAHDRALRLVEEGVPLADAISRAGDEVHRAVGVGEPFYSPALPASTGSVLGADDDDHAYRLAVAAVLDRAAGSEELGVFLAALSDDLAPDGELSTDLSVRLAAAQRDIQADRVMASLRAWLDRTGHDDVIVPNLRRVLDSDGDGTPDLLDGISVDPALLSIARLGAGVPDEARGAAGAVDAGCRSATVELFDREDATVPLVVGAVIGDGSFAVPFGTAEASRPRLWLEAADACARTARIEMANGADRMPPTVNVDVVAIERYGRDKADGVWGGAGAVADGEGPVVAVWIVDSQNGERIARAMPSANGGFVEVAVGSNVASYPLLRIEAVDKAGNVSDRVEIMAGSAPDLPVVDPARITVERTGIGGQDFATGAPGALTGTCKPMEVRFFDEDTDWQATADVGDDGSIPHVDLGDENRTLARVWVEPKDKCGRIGVAVELEAARDREPPVIDPTKIVFSSGVLKNSAEGLAGAVEDESGVAEVRLYETDCATFVRVADEPVQEDGSFVVWDLADFTGKETSICVEAVDKAGNVSPRVKSRRVRMELNAESFASGGRFELAFFENVFDVDPSTVSPGYGAWLSSRLGPAGRRDLAFGYPTYVVAGSQNDAQPFAWRWLDLSQPADGAAVTVLPTNVTVLVRSMGDWPWMVTLRHTCDPGGGCQAGSDWRVSDLYGPPRRDAPAIARAFGFGNDPVILFGGTDGANQFSDTWVLYGSAWSRHSENGGPPGGATVRMVSDPDHFQLPLLVAAVEGESSLQTWQFDLWEGLWTRVDKGAGPPFRTGFGLAVDRYRGQVVLFGGQDADGNALGDTWFWDGSLWSTRTLVPGPSPRYGHGMAWWPERQAVYLHGGSAAGALDSWSWDGARWSHLDPDDGDNGIGVVVADDAVNKGLFTFYTSTVDGTPVFTMRTEHGDPARSADRFLGPAPTARRKISWNPWRKETTLYGHPDRSRPGWSWKTGLWRDHEAASLEFPGQGVMVVDTHRGLRLHLDAPEREGGCELGAPERGGTCAIDEKGNDIAFDVPAWPAGITPSYVYDALEARTIGVGGESWALRGLPSAPEWTRLADVPTGTGEIELAFDPARGRTVLYDGVGTWELDGDAWTFTAPAPTACPGGKLLFDPTAGKLLKLAGPGPSDASCDLACHYDGEWTCGEPQAPEGGLAGAPDPVQGILLAHGAGTKTWIREGSVRHERFAAYSIAMGLPAHAMPLGVAVQLSSGSSFEAQAWSWDEAAWVTLGTSNGSSSYVPFETQLPADPSPFVRAGRIWLQMVPLHGSGLPGSIWFGIQNPALEVEYLLP